MSGVCPDAERIKLYLEEKFLYAITLSFYVGVNCTLHMKTSYRYLDHDIPPFLLTIHIHGEQVSSMIDLRDM